MANKREKGIEQSVRFRLISKREAAKKLKVHHNNVDTHLYRILCDVINK